MICLKCDNEIFEEKEITSDQEYSGKTLAITFLTMVCTNCGFKQLTDEQADELYKKTKEKYYAEEI